MNKHKKYEMYNWFLQNLELIFTCSILIVKKIIFLLFK